MFLLKFSWHINQNSPLPPSFRGRLQLLDYSDVPWGANSLSSSFHHSWYVATTSGGVLFSSRRFFRIEFIQSLYKQNPLFFAMNTANQGGRTWQPFVRSKNGNENFRQARIYNFRVKCVIFARNRKFAKLTQRNMQYIPSCNSALLAQETLFLTQKATFFAQRSPKSA